MAVIINNRFSHGFLLIEVMIALMLLVTFSGIIAYYCSYIKASNYNVLMYCRAISIAQGSIENKVTPDQDITVSRDMRTIQLAELPLQHGFELITVTSSWKTSDQLRSYALIGGTYAQK